MIRKALANYNILSSDKDWLVSIRLPEDAPLKALSAFWPEDDEPEIEGCCPSEIVGLIEERMRYVVSTDRDEKKAAIAWCRENPERLDKEWAAGRVAELNQKIARLQSERNALSKQYELEAEPVG